MKQVNKCCGCFSLKFGGYFFAVTRIFLASLSIVLTTILLYLSFPSIVTSKSEVKDIQKDILKQYNPKVLTPEIISKFEVNSEYQIYLSSIKNFRTIVSILILIIYIAFVYLYLTGYLLIRGIKEHNSNKILPHIYMMGLEVGILGAAIVLSFFVFIKSVTGDYDARYDAYYGGYFTACVLIFCIYIYFFVTQYSLYKKIRDEPKGEIIKKV